MGFRLLAGSDGTTIRNLAFDVDFPVMNGDGVHGVTVSRNLMLNPVQGITNWRGNHWRITRNRIEGLRTRNGGGIGILVGDFAGGTVTGNLVAGNDILGTLTSMPGEAGGYNGTGIVLYADFRYGRAGTLGLTGNTVADNDVHVADGSYEVDIFALELVDTRNDPGLPVVVFDNLVRHNDFRGTPGKVMLTPENLGPANTFTANRE